MSHLLGLGLLVYLLIFLLPAWDQETRLSQGPWLPLCARHSGQRVLANIQTCDIPCLTP